MKSRYNNVYWAKTSSKWMARVCLHGKQNHLGVFESEESANMAVIEFKAKNNVHVNFQELPDILLSYECVDGALYARFNTIKHKAGDAVGYIDSAGYCELKHNGKPYKAHRVIWEMTHGEIPSNMEIDHINGIRLDNRIENLRLATRRENMRNTRVGLNNQTGIKGVFKKRSGRYEVSIGDGNGRHKYIGYYSDFFDACCARKSAETKSEYHENHGRKFS